ncbi:MAG: hypothetical protein WDZ57_01005, partial [Demequina sp.]
MMVCMSARQRPSHAKHPSGVRRAMLSVTIGALAVVTAGAVVMTTENPWVTADAPQVAKQAGEPVRPAPMVALPDLAPESEPQTVEFSVVTAGDVLPHGPVNTSARPSGAMVRAVPVTSGTSPSTRVRWLSRQSGSRHHASRTAPSSRTARAAARSSPA